MEERIYRREKRVVGCSVAIICLVLWCAGLTGCKGREVVNVIEEQKRRIEEQYALANEGNQQKVDEQVIGGVGEAVREGNALIEGNKVCENGIITNEAYKGMVEKHLSIKGYDTSLHTWTEFYSKTLGKVVLIDNNKKNGSRQVYDVDGTRFYRVGEGFKDRPIEEELQTYVAMKGLANAIDGSK